MMDRSRVIIIFAIIFGAASGARLNDGIREVYFKKMSNESGEYEFEYDLDNGDTFRGETYAVTNGIYFMFGAEKEIYWTIIESDKHKEDEKFTKIVRNVERDGNDIRLQDDSFHYHLTLDGHFSTHPYKTTWDIENICFTKADNQTFNFTLSATNNSRKYTGTTHLAADDPKIQHFTLLDDIPSGVFEMDFTDNELLSDEEFCRKIEKAITFFPVVLAGTEGSWANPLLIKSMVG